MGCLKESEITLIEKLFRISGGYIFNYEGQSWNRSKTKELIKNCCNIDIDEDENYKGENHKALSQQKCVEKIFRELDKELVCELLKELKETNTILRQDEDMYAGEDEDEKKVDEIIKGLIDIKKS